MRAYDIIKKKRDGGELTEEEISALVKGAANGTVPDYQIAAFLMAVFLRGMTEAETLSLTRAMLFSGKVMDLSVISGPKVDKHSTGGVGDKTSIILAPLLAAAGVIVPMVSGRGLGHTGGTLDKLESIPGFRTAVPAGEFPEQLRRIGAVMAGQTAEIAPADRKLYALRDVTATVECIPLIASSIMSKKLAEGLDGLVLDVKVGAGAFMKKRGDAERLGRALVVTGKSMGVRTSAILTDMEQPLGLAIGNSLEIRECIACLKGQWPDDLREMTLTLGSRMLEAASESGSFTFRVNGREFGPASYKEGLTALIGQGLALRKFGELITAQHGDARILERPDLLPAAKITRTISADSAGFIQRLDAEKTGIAAMMLGAGREKAEDEVDHGAGIVLSRKVGDPVRQGEPLAVFHAGSGHRISDAEEVFRSGIRIGGRPEKGRPVVLGVIE